MSGQLAERDANRLRAPSWRDPRLVVGLLLVLGSVVAGARLVASFDHREKVYAAGVALAPGQVVRADQLTKVEVALGGQAERYLSAGDAPPAGAVALREVKPGELVPRSAVGRADQSGKPVMVPVDQDAARMLSAGDMVDVWVNARRPGAASSGPDAYGTPVRMLSQAAVSRVPDPASGRLGAARGTVGVLVLVPAEQVERVIAAVDQEARFTLVPSLGAGAGSASAGSAAPSAPTGQAPRPPSGTPSGTPRGAGS